MPKQLEFKYNLFHEGRQLNKNPLSEAGKFDAFQILIRLFDEGKPDAIDPDEVEVIDITETK